MYNEKIEGLIKAALADGELTEKKKQILFRSAQSEGIDLDEFEMVLNARLIESKKVEKEKQKSAPKSNKFGEMLKCPVCGAIVANGMAACGECGYAFTDSVSTVAMDKLYERLEKIDQEFRSSGVLSEITAYMSHERKCKAKMQAIQTMNIPNTRAELLGVLATIQDLANPLGPKKGGTYQTQEEDLSYAYYLLYANCIKKAKISFASDKSFFPYYKKYEELLAKSKKIHISKSTKISIISILALVGFMVFVFSLVFRGAI